MKATGIKSQRHEVIPATRWRFWLVAGTVMGLGLWGLFLFNADRQTQPAALRRSQPVRHYSTSRHGSSALATTLSPVALPLEAGNNDTNRAATATETLTRVLAVLANATPQERQTAEQFMRFAATGHLETLRSLSRTDVEALAKKLAENIPANEIAARLEGLLGIPRTMTLAGGDSQKSLVDLYDLALGTANPDGSGDPLTFTDNCDINGTVTGNIDTLPAGAKRVYAVFENAHNLANRDYVIAVWRNPADEQMVFTETEPIRRDAPSNYVWLQADDGWPAGTYQLELCDPQHPNRVLARRQFTVR
jgi:hypothetical protein